MAAIGGLPAIVAAPICIVLLVLAPGHAWWRGGASSAPRLLTCFALSTVWTSIVGLLLAAFGAFSLERVVAVGALVTAAGHVVHLAAGTWHDRSRWSRAAAVGPLVAVVSLALYWPPFETHMGGSDSTAYLAAGLHLARTGALSKADPLLDELPLHVRKTLFWPALGKPDKAPFVRQPGGLMLTSTDATVAYPNFFPVPMIWSALFAATIGPRYGGGYAPLFAALAVWAVWALARRRLGPLEATAVATLVALNVACYWAGRFALSEPLTWFLLWAGLVALDAWERDGNARDAPLAGALLGAAGLVRLDYLLFVAVALTIRWLALPAVAGRRLPPAFTIAFASMAVATAAQVVFIEGGYALPITDAWKGLQYRAEVAWHDDPWQLAGLTGTAAAGAAGLAWLLGPIRAAAISAVAGFVIVYTVFASRPHLGLSLSWMNACLGVPTAVLAVGGAYELWQQRRRRTGDGFLLILVALIGSLLLYDPHVHQTMLWALRRFVPFVVPAAIVVAAIGADALMRRWRVVGAAAWLALAAALLWPARGLWQQDFYRGAHEQVAQLEALVPDGATLLIDTRLAPYMLGTPLWLEHDRDCLPVTATTEAGRKMIAGIVFNLTRTRPVYFLGPASAPIGKVVLVTPKPAGKYTLSLLFPDQKRPSDSIGSRRHELPLSLYEMIPYRGGKQRDKTRATGQSM